MALHKASHETGGVATRTRQRQEMSYEVGRRSNKQLERTNKQQTSTDVPDLRW
jgi:hypothetical protein